MGRSLVHGPSLKRIGAVAAVVLLSTLLVSHAPAGGSDSAIPTAPPSIEIIKQVRIDDGPWLDADTPPGPDAIAPASEVFFRFTVSNTGGLALTDLDIFELANTNYTLTFPGAVIDANDPLAPGDSFSFDLGPFAAVSGQHFNEVMVTAATVPPAGNFGPDPHPWPGEKNHYTILLADGQLFDGSKHQGDVDLGLSEKVHISCSDRFGFDDSDPSNDGYGADGAPVAGIDPPIVAFFITNFKNKRNEVKRTCGGGEVPAPRVVMDSDRAHYYGAAPRVRIEKATNGHDADAAPGPTITTGEPVQWTYRVTNSGDTGLANVTVTDDQGVAVSCPKSSLRVGESMTCTGRGAAVAGQYRNQGTVTADPPVGPAVDDTDPSHYYGAAPRVRIEKATNGHDADAAPGPTITTGEPVQWTYRVTNSGDTGLANVTVTDDQGVAVSCPKSSLRVGESMTCTGRGAAVAGQYRNQGTVTADPPVGPAVDDTDPSHYYGAAPRVRIEKATNGHDADVAPGPTITTGEPVQWTYRVTNSGDTGLANVTVTDDQGVAVSCPKSSLRVGESMTCTGRGAAVAGQYRNQGTVTADPPTGPRVADSDPSHYWGLATPGVRIEKATNGHDADAAPGPTITTGEPVQWTYRVTNSGDTGLANVTVTDDQGVAVSCPKSSLRVGESMTCTGRGAAVAGQYRNQGTVTADPPTGPRVADSDPSHYWGLATADVRIEKFTNGHDADLPDGPDVPVIGPGQPLTWRYEVTNVGGGSLNDSAVSVTDSDATVAPVRNAGVGSHDGDTLLEPGETWIYEASTQALDLAQLAGDPGVVAGCGYTDAVGNPATRPTYTNTGTVAFPGGSDSDPSHYCNPRVDLQVEIDAIPEEVIAGLPFDYQLTVTNLGPSTATDVVLLDLLPARCFPGSVGPLGQPCPVQTDPPFVGSFAQFPAFGDYLSGANPANGVSDPGFQIDNPDISPFSERQKPQGASFGSVSATPGAVCAYDSAVHGVRCDLASLASGESFTATISMTMDPFARVRVWNRAWVYADETPSGLETNVTKIPGTPCGDASNTNGWPSASAEPFPQPAGPGCNYAKANITVLVIDRVGDDADEPSEPTVGSSTIVPDEPAADGDGDSGSEELTSAPDEPAPEVGAPLDDGRSGNTG